MNNTFILYVKCYLYTQYMHAKTRDLSVRIFPWWKLFPDWVETMIRHSIFPQKKVISLHFIIKNKGAYKNLHIFVSKFKMWPSEVEIMVQLISIVYIFFTILHIIRNWCESLKTHVVRWLILFLRYSVKREMVSLIL